MIEVTWMHSYNNEERRHIHRASYFIGDEENHIYLRRDKPLTSEQIAVVEQFIGIMAGSI